MRKLEGEDRAHLYKVIGGTNTPYRRFWQRQMSDGRKGGYYRTHVGEVDEVYPADNGAVVTRVKTKDGLLELNADYIIDATGLEADIAEHRVLNDLLEHSGAGRNPIGRLDVERDFEIRGTQSGEGVMYASGTATLGGYFPGVDTFLGLQIAAQEICDDLARRGFCRRIGPFRSTSQWFKWARNKKI
jgi:lysine/ornithine N-monooxygenase